MPYFRHSYTASLALLFGGTAAQEKVTKKRGGKKRFETTTPGGERIFAILLRNHTP